MNKEMIESRANEACCREKDLALVGKLEQQVGISHLETNKQTTTTKRQLASYRHTILE
jgi:hypothetical protein